MNPEGLKQYLKQKKQQEEIKKGGTTHKMGPQGGYAVSQTEVKDGKIIDKRTKKTVMDMDQLQEILNERFK